MRAKVLLFILPIAILVVALFTGFNLVWRLFVLAVAVILLSYLWTRLNTRSLESRAKPLPRQCQVGESFNQEITLLNRDRIPKLFLEVQEETDLPGYHNIVTTSLPADGVRCWETNVRCRRRGEYHLGALTVTASDPFGLFHRRLKMGQPQNIIICPATLDLPLFEPLSRQGTGYGPERWLAGQLGPVASVREYSAGDSLKRIHWHSTAHTGRLMVKVFDPERSRKVAKNVWVVLDMHKESHLSLGEDTTEDCAVTIAASVIKKYIDEAMPIGMMAAGDQPYLFPPEVGEQHLWHLLTTLALIKANGSTPIDQLISKEPGRFGYNSILIVITTSTSERLIALLRQIKSHGGVVVAIIIDPISFGGAAGAGNAARTLMSSGVQVHVVGRGDDLPVVLDSRTPTHLPENPTASDKSEIKAV